MVHGEVTARDFTWQFANPCGHPHHPVQHDPDKGRFVYFQCTTFKILSDVDILYTTEEQVEMNDFQVNSN